MDFIRYPSFRWTPRAAALVSGLGAGPIETGKSFGQCYTGKVKRVRQKAHRIPQAKTPALDWRALSRYALVGAVIFLALAHVLEFVPCAVPARQQRGHSQGHPRPRRHLREYRPHPRQPVLPGHPRRPVPAAHHALLISTTTPCWATAPTPAGYHWLNFWLHAINIALVYALGLVLFEEIPAALALAALWATPSRAHRIRHQHRRPRRHAGRLRRARRFALLPTARWQRRRTPGGMARGDRARRRHRNVFEGERHRRDRRRRALRLDVRARRSVARASRWATPPSRSRSSLFFAVGPACSDAFPAGPFPFTDNPLLGAASGRRASRPFRQSAKYFGLLVWPARLAPDYSYRAIPVTVGAQSHRPSGSALAPARSPSVCGAARSRCSSRSCSSSSRSRRFRMSSS